MTNAEMWKKTAEGWMQEAKQVSRLALSLRGKIDGWTPEQTEAITGLVEGAHLFDPYLDLSRDDFELMLNMNDTFGYACADGEKITPEEAVDVYAISKEFGSDGVTAWAAKHRADWPLDQIAKREKFQQAWKRLHDDDAAAGETGEEE